MRTLLAIVLSVLTVGYLLPTSIAVVRRAPVLLCFLVNVLLGWTVSGGCSSRCFFAPAAF